jgi:hypothetical protein
VYLAEFASATDVVALRDGVTAEVCRFTADCLKVIARLVIKHWKRECAARAEIRSESKSDGIPRISPRIVRLAIHDLLANHLAHLPEWSAKPGEFEKK